MNDFSGRCECGGVTFHIDGPLRDVFNCHCGRCRRFTGHHMAASQAATADVKFGEQATLRWYSPDPTVEYGFCSTCGSSLFWRATNEPGFVSVCAGTIDGPTGLRTTQAWFVAEALDYHTRPGGVTEYPYE